MTTTTKTCEGPGCTVELELLPRTPDQPEATRTFCSRACLAAWVAARLTATRPRPT